MPRSRSDSPPNDGPAGSVDRVAGLELLINSDYRNDVETHELMAAEIMPHFA
jgi:hypothetical protein